MTSVIIYVDNYLHEAVNQISRNTSSESCLAQSMNLI